MSFGYIPDFRGNSLLADLYLRIFGYQYPSRRNEARLIFKKLKTNKAEVILDLGCGDGVWYNELNKRGINVVGIDISQNYVVKAKNRALKMGFNYKLVLGDAQSLCFKDEIFDKLFSICTFEHIPCDEKAFRESFRVLKPGGLFVLSVYHKIPSLCNLFLKLPKPLKYLFGSSIIKNVKDEKEFKAKLDEKNVHFRNYQVEELIKKIKIYGYEVEDIDFNLKFFGSFVGGLIHSLRIFEFKEFDYGKANNTTYIIKNQLTSALLFLITYPFFVLDDLIPFEGCNMIIKLRKPDLKNCEEKS